MPTPRGTVRRIDLPVARSSVNSCAPWPPVEYQTVCGPENRAPRYAGAPAAPRPPAPGALVSPPVRRCPTPPAIGYTYSSNGVNPRSVRPVAAGPLLCDTTTALPSGVHVGDR